MAGRTLYGKLVLALLALFLVAGVAFVTLSVFTTRHQLQEVTQTLHRSVAANIVKEQWLMRGEAINKPALKSIFSRLMAVNPSIEVYLLGSDGRILSYSAPPEAVKRDRVALGPIMTFLDPKREFPIRGDDPRDPDGQKVFSAAPIYDSGKMAGFLYIVLGGQVFDSVLMLFQQSQIFRLSAGFTVAALLLTALLGAWSFNWLTRRLRRLAHQVDRFRQAGFTEALRLPGWRRDEAGDEIDQLGVTFEEMSARITEQIEKLQAADAARRDMVAAVSHDLRTPLASLQGYLETLELKNDTLTEDEKRDYLKLALGHGERLSRLIADLFELATLEADDAQLNAEPFLINELANDVAQKFKLEAEKKNLRLTTEISETVPFVSGDIGLMERVLDNLIGNAIKYTPEGGAIVLSVATADGEVATAVTDTGPGIAAGDLPHIFDRFYQVDRSRPATAKGAGLGLAIAQRILHLHGRAIEVDSTPGAGTTFRFRLPAAA